MTRIHTSETVMCDICGRTQTFKQGDEAKLGIANRWIFIFYPGQNSQIDLCVSCQELPLREMRNCVFGNSEGGYQ